MTVDGPGAPDGGVRLADALGESDGAVLQYRWDAVQKRRSAGS
jgi:hypothetical protein